MNSGRIRLLLAFALFSLGFVLYLFWFCLWGLSLIGWGCLIARRLSGEHSWGLAMGWGGVFYAALILQITLVLGVGAGAKACALLVVLAGLFFWIRESAQFYFPVLKNPWDVGALTIAGLFILKVLWQATVPQLHGDPLYYHLLGPRLWLEHAHAGVQAQHPIATGMGGAWDALYLWPTLLMGEVGGGGRVEIHLVGQWIHLFLGWLGSGLLIYEMLRESRQGIGISILLPVLVLSFRPLLGTAPLAKNDWGAISWILLGMRTRGRICAAIPWGAALMTKLSMGFAILPLWLMTEMKSARARLVSGGVALGGVLFWGWWKWRDAGNPFFPYLDPVFHSPLLSGTFRRVIGQVSVLRLDHESLSSLGIRLNYLLKVDAWVIALGATSVLRFTRYKDSALVFGAGLLAFLLSPVPSEVGDGTFGVRVIGATWVIGTVLLMRRLSLRQEWGLVFALCVGWKLFLAPVHPAPRHWVEWSATEWLEKRGVRLSQLDHWRRGHLSSKVLTDDPRVYYTLSSLPYAVVEEIPELDRLFLSSNKEVWSRREVLAKIEAQGFDYYYLSPHFENQWWTALGGFMSDMTQLSGGTEPARFLSVGDLRREVTTP